MTQNTHPTHTKQVVLTGVKPTGPVHIGNYIGAIRPALEMAKAEDTLSLLFCADYHALTYIEKADELTELTYNVAATWLALGLDPEKTIFYRQSEIPEIFELAWILACMTPKGLMNRAHAYKAKQSENQEFGREDLDFGINTGLFTYPVLMAADIILFDTDVVPVGEDQVQHIEIARDIAEKFNRTFGNTLKLPKAKVQQNTAVIPGLDGRKMSKSYNNTIPVFTDQKSLRKMVMRIVTDSTPPEAPKSTEGNLLFTLYTHFATPTEIEALKERYAKGIGWGEVKQALFEVIDRTFTEPRAKYQEFMQNREHLDKILCAGRDRARHRAKQTMARVHKAIGRSW